MSHDDNPVDLYIAAYADPGGAGRDLADLKRLEDDGMIELDALVLVSRDAYGKIHVEDSAHDVRRGSIIGAVGGLVAGLIFPPALLASGAVGAAVGAGLGGLHSHRDKKRIEADVDQVLPPNSSGIIAVFEERWSDGVDRALLNAELVKKEKVGRESVDELKSATEAAAR